MENANCNLCGSSEYKTKVDLNEYHDSYMSLIHAKPKYNQLRECAHCKLTYRSPQFTEDEASALYSGPYRDNILKSMTAEGYFNKIISIPIDQSELYEKINWLKLKIEKYSQSACYGKNMIDVGCGIGAFLFWFEKIIPGWNKNGIEPTSEFACVASLKSDAKIINDEYKPGIFDSKFNLICVIQVLEHIPNPIHFLKSLKIELATNGIIFIEVPSDANIFHRDPSDDVFMSPHLFFLNEGTFKILASEAQLNIIEYESVKNYRGIQMERALLKVQ